MAKLNMYMYMCTTSIHEILIELRFWLRLYSFYSVKMYRYSSYMYMYIVLQGVFSIYMYVYMYMYTYIQSYIA